MMKLTKSQIEKLLKGNSWFATGGGFPANRARNIFNTILQSPCLELTSLDEFNNEDLLCVCSGVGSISKTNIDLTKRATKAVNLLQTFVNGRKIKGIVSGEVGLECIAADAAGRLGIPLVDADMKGGRAAPEPSINMFNLHGKAVLPAVAINTDGDLAVLTEISSAQKLEVFLRHFANMACGTFIAWCPRPASEFKKYLLQNTITRAIGVGKLIENEMSIIKIARSLSGRIIFKGNITSIDEIENMGFLVRKVFIKNHNVVACVWIKNENLVITVDDKPVLTCPDLITIVDLKTRAGIHNSNLRLGMNVAIVGIPHDKCWHTQRGHKIFSPVHFSLPFPVVRLQDSK